MPWFQMRSDPSRKAKSKVAKKKTVTKRRVAKKVTRKKTFARKVKAKRKITRVSWVRGTVPILLETGQVNNKRGELLGPFAVNGCYGGTACLTYLPSGGSLLRVPKQHKGRLKKTAEILVGKRDWESAKIKKAAQAATEGNYSGWWIKLGKEVRATFERTA